MSVCSSRFCSESFGVRSPESGVWSLEHMGIEKYMMWRWKIAHREFIKWIYFRDGWVCINFTLLKLSDRPDNITYIRKKNTVENIATCKTAKTPTHSGPTNPGNAAYTIYFRSIFATIETKIVWKMHSCILKLTLLSMPCSMQQINRSKIYIYYIMWNQERE